MRRCFMSASVLLVLVLSPICHAEVADELDAEDYLPKPTGAQVERAPNTSYPERDEDHPLWNQRRTHSCTGYLCGSVESAMPILMPRTFKTTMERDNALCTHMALLSTPHELAEGGEEALVRFLLTTGVSIVTRGALGQSWDAAVDNGILNGSSAGAGGFANGLEGTKRAALRAKYVCFRMLGYPVMPFGR